MLSEKQNLKLLDKRISELNLNGDIVLAFDFDELVVPIHLTREVTRKVSKPVDMGLLEQLGSCSFKGIRYLNSLFYGYDFKKYEIIRNKIAKETVWTEGFDKLLKRLMDEYSVIFISSGLKDICEAKLAEIGFDSKNILGGELKIENNEITGSNLVISDELKGYVINELKKNYKIIAIGHSLGDKTMLDNADTSISINSKISDLAKYDVKTAKELIDIIEKII